MFARWSGLLFAFVVYKLAWGNLAGVLDVVPFEQPSTLEVFLCCYESRRVL